MKRLYMLLSLIIICITCTPVQAQSLARAVLGPLSFKLVDLDKNDGVTPYIQFSTSTFDDSVLTEVYAQSYDGGVNNNLEQFYSNPNSFVALEAGVNTAMSNARSSITGSQPLDARLLAEGEALGRLASSPANSFSSYSAYSHTYGYFTLSANTELTISGFADMRAVTSASFDPLAAYGDIESANAYISLMMLLSGNQVSDEINLAASNTNGSLPPNNNLSESRLISLTMRNPFTTTANGFISGAAEVTGYSRALYTPPSEVPLPATAVLIFPGLALIVLASNKRKAS